MRRSLKIETDLFPIALMDSCLILLFHFLAHTPNIYHPGSPSQSNNYPSSPRDEISDEERTKAGKKAFRCATKFYRVQQARSVTKGRSGKGPKEVYFLFLRK
ncbi:hypothetical protein VTN49DRAFT_7807 [Thermomyces lanuginosus]|uniref:uncharacterized protein n=1 Tax=Thermomyces lanuginosus TaxID=5541 RepID=UPI0037425106